MIENTNGFLIDDNLSEQTVHLLGGTNSNEQDYLNVEQHALQEAVYPQTATSTNAMADVACNQEYNSFPYESQTAQRLDKPFSDSSCLLNENSNSFMQNSVDLFNRNVTAIKNNSKLSSSNDINIVRYIIHTQVVHCFYSFYIN